ncbi:MAG: guanylate kinase [Spirochaetia bacterium]|nr:guanylate kinase [Spirochaetia bacterium]
MKNKGIVFVVSAPSGTGKTTVINEFLKSHIKDFVVSVSVTTRAPRKGEQNGRDYFFFTKEKFRQFIKKGRFLEYAPVLDNYYGTLKQTVKSNINKGKNVIMDIDVQGAKKIKKEMPEAVTIFIIPPSFRVLSERLKNRKTESEKAVAQRLKLAKKELKERLKYDYIIINKELTEAKGFLECIYSLEKFRRYGL